MKKKEVKKRKKYVSTNLYNKNKKNLTYGQYVCGVWIKTYIFLQIFI